MEDIDTEIVKEAVVTDKGHGFRVVVDAVGDVSFEGPGATSFLVAADEWIAMVRAVDIARTALATPTGEKTELRPCGGGGTMKEPKYVAQQRERAKESLRTLMTEISERCWCAGWIGGLEFALWASLDHRADESYGQGFVYSGNKRQLARLALQAGGWWVMTDNFEEVFLSMPEWAEFYEQQRGGEVEK